MILIRLASEECGSGKVQKLTSLFSYMMKEEQVVEDKMIEVLFVRLKCMLTLLSFGFLIT